MAENESTNQNRTLTLVFACDHRIDKTEYEFYQTCFWGNEAPGTTNYTKASVREIAAKMETFKFIKFNPNREKNMEREAELDLTNNDNYTDRHVPRESPYPLPMFQYIDGLMQDDNVLEVTKGLKLIKMDTNKDGIIDYKDATEVCVLVMFKLRLPTETMYFDIIDNPGFSI